MELSAVSLRRVWRRFSQDRVITAKHRPEIYGIKFPRLDNKQLLDNCPMFGSGTAKGQSSQAIELDKD